MDIKKRKRINVSVAFFLIWLSCLMIYYFFCILIKPTLLNSILIIFFETSLCIMMWIFFIIKIDWLKDLKTNREIMHLNTSNVLSAIRFSLVPMLISMFGIINNHERNLSIKIIIFIFAFLVCLTDLFDGMIARKFNEVTKLGMILDPVGDFLMITCFAVLIFSKGIIYWWFFILIIVRIPILFIVMILMLVFKIKFLIKTTPLGKITVFYTTTFLGIATVKLFHYNTHQYFDYFLFFTQIVGSIIIILSSIEKIIFLINYLKNQDKLKDKVSTSDFLNKNLDI